MFLRIRTRLMPLAAGAALVVVGIGTVGAQTPAGAATSTSPVSAASAFAAAPTVAISHISQDVHSAAYVAAPKTLDGLLKLPSNAVQTGVHPRSASGWTTWGGFTFKGYGIPGGTLYGEIDGSGLHISGGGGSFVTYSSICEWNINQLFYDTTGKLWGTASIGVTNNCTGAGATKYGYNQNVPAGHECVVLYSEWMAVRIAAACETIHS